MEKIIEYEIKTTTRTYEYYCDDCGKLIMKSIEFDDGWVEEPKTFYIQHVRLKGHFCKECGQKRVDKVTDYARSMGFDI